PPAAPASRDTPGPARTAKQPAGGMRTGGSSAMYTSLECGMARNGFRIFDSDTHVGPYMDVLERYLSAGEKSQLAAWAPYRSSSKGHPVYTKGARRYLRKLGTAAAEPDKGGYMPGFTGAKREREPPARGE